MESIYNPDLFDYLTYSLQNQLKLSNTQDPDVKANGDGDGSPVFGAPIPKESPKSPIPCKSCSKPSSTRCGNCNNAYYCSKPCQLKDWRKGGHKINCFPLERRVISGPEGDRVHIFSTKSFKAGDILWKEPPLVYSTSVPEHYPKFKEANMGLCIVCCTAIPKSMMRPCAKCEIELCPSDKCHNDDIRHAAFECDMLGRAEARYISDDSLEQMKLSDFLLLVRLIELKKYHPENFAKFLSLNWHPQRLDITEILPSTRVKFSKKLMTKLHEIGVYLRDYLKLPRVYKEWCALTGAIGLLMQCPEQGGFTPREMEEVVNKMRWNSFEDEEIFRPDISCSHVRWIAYYGSSLEHSCYPNVTYKVDVDDGLLVFRARFNIKVGEELTLCRYPAFEDSSNLVRRQMLLGHKNFLCSCKRCEDPTELRSFASAFKCLIPSCSGYLLVNSPFDPKLSPKLQNPNFIVGHGDSTCSKCFSCFPMDQVEKIYNNLNDSNTDFFTSPQCITISAIQYEKKAARLMIRWERTFVHRNNSLILNMKFTCASRLTGYVLNPPIELYGKYEPMKEKVPIMRKAFLYWDDILNANPLSIRGCVIDRGLVLMGSYCCLAFIALYGTKKHTFEFYRQFRKLAATRVEAENILRFRSESMGIDRYLDCMEDLQLKLRDKFQCLRKSGTSDDEDSDSDCETALPLGIQSLQVENKKRKIVCASKAFEAGEVLWTERPLVYAATDSDSYKKIFNKNVNICTVCCMEYPLYGGKRCQKCNAGTCGSEKCLKSRTHASMECHVLTSFRIREGRGATCRRDFVLLLRILKLREDPKSWKKFMNLPNHPYKYNLASFFSGHKDKEVTKELLTELIQNPYMLPPYTQDYVQRLAGLAKFIIDDVQATSWSIKDLDDVLCRLEWNAIDNEVDELDTLKHVSFIAPIGSQLRHSCTPNVIWKVDKEFNLVFRALVDIKAEDQLFICREPSILGLDTVQRREALYTGKHYVCRCPLCSDPTEFGSYTSAVKCLNKHCTGYLLMINTLNSHNNDVDWKCNTCSNLYDWEKVYEIIDKATRESEIVNLTLRNSLTSCCVNTKLKLIAEAENICKKWMVKFFHPNHFIVVATQFEINRIRFSNLFEIDLDKERANVFGYLGQAKGIAQYCRYESTKKGGIEESFTPRRGKLLGFYYCSLSVIVLSKDEALNMEFSAHIKRLDQIRTVAESILKFYEKQDKLVDKLLMMIQINKEDLDKHGYSPS